MKKRIILGRVASNLKKFKPELEGHFMCPTCLTVIALSEQSKISEAHIVPRSSGGKLKTFLCKQCNSKFGTLQDKWFGEYVNILHNSTSPFSESKQKGYFSINDVRVSGKFRENPDRSLDVMIWQDKISPETRKNLDAAMKESDRTGRSSIEIPVPLYENKGLVSIGFLTSAYLLWFKELGYSWVLQDHLDIVRQQILNPNDSIIDANFIGTVNGDIFQNPWIGIAHIRDEIVPIAGISDKLIILPPAGCARSFYEDYPFTVEDFTLNESSYEIVRLSDGHRFPDPMGIIYKDRIAILPDQLKNNPDEMKIMLFPGEGASPQLLIPTTKDEAGEISGLPNTITKKIKFPHR